MKNARLRYVPIGLHHDPVHRRCLTFLSFVVKHATEITAQTDAEHDAPADPPLKQARIAAQELFDLDVPSIPVGIKMHLWSGSVHRKGCLVEKTCIASSLMRDQMPNPRRSFSSSTVSNAQSELVENGF